MKNNFNKTIYLLINFFFISILFLGIVYNSDKMVVHTFVLLNKNYILNSAILLFAYSMIAHTAGFFFCMFIKSDTQARCNAYQKKHENITLEKDENLAKIASLEAKIQTLEVALESALKNK